MTLFAQRRVANIELRQVIVEDVPDDILTERIDAASRDASVTHDHCLPATDPGAVSGVIFWSEPIDLPSPIVRVDREVVRDVVRNTKSPKDPNRVSGRVVIVSGDVNLSDPCVFERLRQLHRHRVSIRVQVDVMPEWKMLPRIRDKLHDTGVEHWFPDPEKICLELRSVFAELRYPLDCFFERSDLHEPRLTMRSLIFARTVNARVVTDTRDLDRVDSSYSHVLSP